MTLSQLIKAFQEKYPEGSIRTELLSEVKEPMMVVRALVFKDNQVCVATAHAHSKDTDGVATLMDVENESITRALLLAGID